MRRRAAWVLLVWFAVALTGCETIKGVGRDVMNLGDVITGKKPGHTTQIVNPQKTVQGIPGQGQVVGYSQKTQ